MQAEIGGLYVELVGGIWIDGFEPDKLAKQYGTFYDPMFPRLKYFGEPSVSSPVNLFHLNPGSSFAITDKVTLRGDVQFLWR